VLVGREAELTELEDALLAALRGEGRMVLLSGDAGMGKTRLVTELGGRARGIGVTVLSGGCSEATLAMPYLPFLEALGNYIARSDLAVLRERLGESAAELGALFPRLGPAPVEASDPAQAKLRLFEAIMHLLEVAAGESGLLLVMEDLHAADASTRELLDLLARRLQGARILVAGTYRGEEVGRKHPMHRDLQSWRRKGLAQVIELKPLDEREVEDMVQAIFDEPSEAETGRFLHERCEGNPFVLEELLKEAIDLGDIYRTERGWERKELSEFRLPRTVRDTILLRLERLEPDQVRMLRAAATLGDTFQDSALIAVAGEGLSSVQEALRACVQQQLVREDVDGGGTYHFRHALTREAVYEDLISTERQEYHRRAAEWLNAQPGTGAAVVAGHLIAAGLARDAVPLCLEAAARAEETWALVEAAELYEAALPYVQDPLERADLLKRLGNCTRYASRPGAAGAAERYLEEAVRLFDAAGKPVEAARVRVTLAGSYYPRLRHALAERELRVAIDALEPLGPSQELADAYNHLAFFRIVQLDGPGCTVWAAKALAAAEAEGVGLAQVRAQNLMGLGLASEGRVEEAIEWLDRSATVAAGHGWTWYALAAMNNTLLLLPLERWVELPARVERMRSVDPNHFMTLNCQAMLALGQGFPARAAELAESARETSASREWAVSVFWTNCTLVHAYAAMGRVEDARRTLPAADRSLDLQDQLSRWGAELQLALAGGGGTLARSSPAPVANLVTGWPWALERELGLQALIDLGAGDRVEADLREAPDTAFFRGLRIDLARARGEHSAVLSLAPAFIEQSGKVGARLFADRALLALAEATARLGSAPAAKVLLQHAMNSAVERGHRAQQRQVSELASSLGMKLEEDQPGLRVPEPRAAGERFVTVLFADVRGYTALSESVAPPAMADKIASLQRTAAREVARHHGTVDKFAGDAVMATFNVSGASLDHASHALRAAVAIRDRARYMGLSLGIGIASGPAIVGRLSQGGNMSVLGQTTNLAARLQAQAGPNEIVLSEESWRRLRERVDATPEMLELKGFPQPVAAYRMV
jgi:class 3 adenylate cyclase